MSKFKFMVILVLSGIIIFNSYGDLTLNNDINVTYSEDEQIKKENNTNNVVNTVLDSTSEYSPIVVSTTSKTSGVTTNKNMVINNSTNKNINNTTTSTKNTTNSNNKTIQESSITKNSEDYTTLNLSDITNANENVNSQTFNNSLDNKQVINKRIINSKIPSLKKGNLSNKSIVLIDKSQGTYCAQAIDYFYEDASYKYYFTCKKSQNMYVRVNGIEYKLVDALNNGIVTIKDLEQNGYKFLKQSKNLAIR